MPAPITVYATQSDLSNYGLNPAALATITPTQITAALATASSVIDDALRGQYDLPLVKVGLSITRACAIIAAYDLLVARGFDPSIANDRNFVSRYYEIVGDPEKPDTAETCWLGKVAAGKLNPDLIDSGAGSEGEPTAGPRIASSSQRGWSGRVGTQQTNTGNNGPFSSD